MNLQPLDDIAIHAIEGSFGYLDPIRLYFAQFRVIPSLHRVYDIDISKARHWIENNCTVLATYCNNAGNVDPFSDSSEVYLYITDQQLMLHLEENNVAIIYPGHMQDLATVLVKEAANWKKAKQREVIGLVVHNGSSLETKFVKFKKPELDLSKQYNEDLLPVHEKLTGILNEKDRSGIVLFHGSPGTGKSTYIRYLISHTNKKVIYLTPELAGSMGSPEIARYLLNNANSVFVIEDAEQLIVSRERERNSSISTMLNLTDGILGESLGIQIIATFNTDLYNIDKALLRKGRMLVRYEFKNLVQEKARQLMSDLGHQDAPVKFDMSLADIYNFGEEGFEIARQTIGFSA